MAILSPALLDAMFIAWSTKYKEGLGRAKSSYKEYCMVAPSTGRETIYPWLGQLPTMREWIGERRVKSLQGQGFQIVNRTFETTIEVRRSDIEDDQAGIYSTAFAQLGQDIGEFPDILVSQMLPKGATSKCYDNQNFFDTSHPSKDRGGNDVVVSNYSNALAGPAWYLFDTSRMMMPIIYQERRAFNLERQDVGSGHTFKTDNILYGTNGRCNVGFGLWQLAYMSTDLLTTANFIAAKQAMTGLCGEEGRPLGVRPTLLVVPTSLEQKALDLLKPNLPGGESNTLAGTVEILVSPWL